QGDFRLDSGKLNPDIRQSVADGDVHELVRGLLQLEGHRPITPLQRRRTDGRESLTEDRDRRADTQLGRGARETPVGRIVHIDALRAGRYGERVGPHVARVLVDDVV